MLTINNLHVALDEQADKSVLQGLDLELKAGEVHAIMGPNGSGKSTLSHVLAGRPGYDVRQGQVEFLGQDLLAKPPEARAHMGVFLGFQYPVSLPGVSTLYFLKAALNAQRQAQGLDALDAVDFLTLAREKMTSVGLDESFLYRSLNDGFSGGEKKRTEIMQMLVLEPKLVLLDEIDSGLDIDALQTLSMCINALRDAGRSMLIVTHYQRMLNYIVPDKVHVLMQGKIVHSGDQTLAVKLEERGYGWLE